MKRKFQIMPDESFGLLSQLFLRDVVLRVVASRLTFLLEGELWTELDDR